MSNADPIRYSDYPDVVIDESNVPEPFRPLIPYAKLWSIGDDVVRGEIMENTPPEDLDAFVRAVSPHLDALWEWTQSFHGQEVPIPDEVVIFEMVGEPCEEARMILEELKK